MLMIVFSSFFIFGCSLKYVNDTRESYVFDSIKIINVSELENPATVTDPLTLKKVIEIKSNKTSLIKVGFYNELDKSVNDLGFTISECIDENNKINPHPNIKPNSFDVGALSSIAYELRLDRVTLNPGFYICTITVIQNSDLSEIQKKQFFLEIHS